VESEIRAFIADNFLLGDDVQKLAGSASLIDAGIIDSTGVLELVGFLEDRFGIRIADHELLPENLDTIDNVIRFVGEKQSAAA
jgi:acyl carrier protein